MNKIYFLILASHILVFITGCLFTKFYEKYNNNK